MFARTTLTQLVSKVVMFIFGNNFSLGSLNPNRMCMVTAKDAARASAYMSNVNGKVTVILLPALQGPAPIWRLTFTSSITITQNKEP